MKTVAVTHGPAHAVVILTEDEVDLICEALCVHAYKHESGLYNAFDALRQRILYP